LSYIFKAESAGFKGQEHLKAGPIGLTHRPLPLQVETIGLALLWFYLGILVGIAAQTNETPKQ
jgi:hypothetical protein